MTLSEIYFYILISIFPIASFLIINFSEDLKKNSIFQKYLKWTFLAGFSGILLVFLKCFFFCNYNCILITFSPFITLNIVKLITVLFDIIFKKEPFNVDEFGLSDGLWVKNKGNLKFRGYYALYSTVLWITPLLLIMSIFFVIKKNMC
ncbi:conserved membrane hypothetical protein [Tenacibaculum halocynthiae]